MPDPLLPTYPGALEQPRVKVSGKVQQLIRSCGPPPGLLIRVCMGASKITLTDSGPLKSGPEPAKQNRDRKEADEHSANLKSGKENCVWDLTVSTTAPQHAYAVQSFRCRAHPQYSCWPCSALR